MNNNLLKEKGFALKHEKHTYKRLKSKNETRSKKLEDKKFETKTTTQSKRHPKNKDFKQACWTRNLQREPVSFLSKCSTYVYFQIHTDASTQFP